ncbi:hypothetical protein SAMN05443574_11185 [Haloarcula vallismortis]|uniref:DUF7982 domain-containing protein n=2 Tax=Haloarcula vallismortis TaxID=28442 RepID=M0J160_HALVA|nr:hypothetical protein [Haloarcula vallismortis]EMA02063.1 hypothetical protein C437_16636 [Haloarcula vallismortis ATCC 29715]SDW99894.1 hypothetical protein SAMN05443574_11185 [Haloarcula vallismortis]
MSQPDLSKPDTAADDSDQQTDIVRDRQTLEAELEVLREENRRLRESYAHAKRATFRRTALGFFAVGGLSLVAAFVFPALQTIFIAFGGTGVFAGIVTFYLTPERFVSASVGATVFNTLADVEQHLVSELELQTETVYVPTASHPETTARLFVPQHVEYTVPDPGQLEALFVTGVEAAQGISLPPTGDRLYNEFEQTMSGEFGTAPDAIATQLTAALSEQFELVENTRIEVDGENQTASIAIDNPAFGDIHQLDHPVVSLLAVGFATGLDRPVTVDTHNDDRFSGVVTVSWNEPEEPPAQSSGAATHEQETMPTSDNG